MADQSVPFGVLLRRWRATRRMSQMELALAASSSTRHVSFLETGRSRPSKDMVLRLCEELGLSFRDRNVLLLAAGFAPSFAQRSLEQMDAAKSAMERILRVHMPYPAFALDHHWNVVLSNGALPQLYEGCSPQLLSKPVNAIRLILHPDGMGPRIVNYLEWRAHTTTVLREQIETRADPLTQALLAEVMSYPAPKGAVALASNDGAERYVTPLRIRTRLGTVSFLNTTTVFGAPADITLSELALEVLFPADDATAAIVSRMVDETGQDSADRLLIHKAG
jgi:transcriptional regulator with XRE-family HTH domain